MKNKPYYPTFHGYNSKLNSLKPCKVENYKVDNDLRILYKVTTIYSDKEPKILKTLPLEQLDSHIKDFFFTLMQNFKIENFTIYYENNFDIIKIVNLACQENVVLTNEQLSFLKNFFININNILIMFFDIHVKPVINDFTENRSTNNSNSISNNLATKKRVLN